MAISAARVTRFGIDGCIWRPNGSYDNKEEFVPPPVVAKPRGSGSSGRFFTWTPDKVHNPDKVLQYTKTDLDFELERLLKAAIKREQLAKDAKHIAQVLGRNVNAVSDMHRAARHVEREILTLSQTNKMSQAEHSKQQRKLMDEEDIIMSILLSEI